MKRRGVLSIIVVLVIVGVISIGSVFAISGLGMPGFGDGTGEASQPPALLTFDSSVPECTDEYMTNSSTSIVAGGTNTEITYSRNVSLPGPSYAIGGPTFEQLNETTYVLDIPFENTSSEPRECAGVTRYNGTMRIPAGEEPWQLIVKHDGTTVTTLHGESESSLLGGSAEVGQSVSGSDPSSNATTTAE